VKRQRAAERLHPLLFGGEAVIDFSVRGVVQGPSTGPGVPDPGEKGARPMLYGIPTNKKTAASVFQMNKPQPYMQHYPSRRLINC
jgi:hypothetical protein